MTLHSHRIQFVVLQSFPNIVEAKLAAGLLEGAGIEVRIADEYASGLYPRGGVVGGVKLLVPESSLANAKVILSDHR